MDFEIWNWCAKQENSIYTKLIVFKDYCQLYTFCDELKHRLCGENWSHLNTEYFNRVNVVVIILCTSKKCNYWGKLGRYVVFLCLLEPASATLTSCISCHMTWWYIIIGYMDMEWNSAFIQRFVLKQTGWSCD